MKVNVEKISGDWHVGYVLDKHTESSECIGQTEQGHPKFNTVRTDVGEAIYKLKYKNDSTKISLLTDVFVEHLCNKFKSVGFIVPMPPSKERKFQPLLELSKNISKKMEIPFLENILLKKKKTPQMKDIQIYDDKIKALLESFYINDGINNDGAWDVLLIDDIYFSGASLNAASKVLKTYSKVKNVYVAVFTRTK